MSTESATIIDNAFIQFQGFEEVPAIELAPPAELELPPVESELPPAVQPVLQRQNAGIYSPAQLPQIPTVESDSGSGGVPAAPDLQDILSFKKDFGVLRVKLADTPMTKQPQLLYFKNDMSGSMQDMCSDGRSKMQHSNHTTSNILRLAAETDAEIWVQVDAFDDKVVSIIPAQRVTKDNLPQLVALVNAIMPRNGTNLELALNDSKQKIAEFKEQHPEFVVTQIFTTDGQANTGSQNNSTLAECVEPSYSNIFIGLGLDHSADTLNALSSRNHAAYYFIDKIENGGLVFGEVIHSILYKALVDITLTVENAEIYDYRTNQWSSTLEIDSLTGEAEKTYHLRRDYDASPFDVEVKISGNAATEPFATTVSCIPPLINDDGVETPARLDLSKYIFRQRTQELLYEAKCKATQGEHDKIRTLKTKMRDFLAQMKAYTQTRPELAADSTFQTLNDDLVIVIRTLGTHYQTMYTSARANSNGRECSYNVSAAPGAPRRHPGGLRRSNAINGFQGEDLDQDLEAEVGDELQMLSQGPLARTHTTPRQITLMRSCSSGTQAEHLLDDDETQPQVAPFPAIPEAAEDDSAQDLTQDLTQDLFGGRCCGHPA
jgi:hypothetical protein